MIRAVIITALTALLVLVLYLPSAHPARDFAARLREESGELVHFWSHAHALRVLQKTLAAQPSAQHVLLTPNLRNSSDPPSVQSAAGAEMTAVNERLANSSYFRSLDALLLLAAHRFFTVLEWSYWLGAFCLATLFDGGVARVIKAKQFLHHSPEAFMGHLCAALLVTCGALMAMVLPVSLPPLLLPTAVVACSLFLTGALRNLHARG